MKKSIAAASVTASLAVGGLFGAVLGVPGLAAAETATGAVSWVDEALAGLVDDGTIDQDQADAVEAALDEARPERSSMRHRGGFGHHVDPAVVAEVLGVSEDEVAAALEDDRTIADLAAEQGVEVPVVVDAIVTAKQEHLDRRVAEGDLTQERADEMLAGAEERVTALVEGERPTLGRGGRHGHFRGGHGAPVPGGAEDAGA